MNSQPPKRPSVADFEEGPINLLNEACLMHIILQLPVRDRCIVRQVCRRWRDVSDDWLDVKRVVHFGRADDPDVKEVRIKGNSIIINADRSQPLKGVIARCGKVVKSMIDYRRNSSAMSVAAKHCPQLEELELRINSKYHDRRLIRVLSANMTIKRLQLNLEGDGQERYKCIEAVNSSVIQDLEIHATRPTLYLDEMNALISRLSCIQRFSSNIVDDDALQKLCRKTTLRSLEFSQVADRTISENGLLGIMSLSNLRDIKITCQPRLWGPRLEISQTFVRNLADACPQLEGVHISGCRSITDEVFDSLSRLSSLEDLAIIDCPNIRGETVYLCSGIKVLSFESCRRVHDAAIIKLLQTSTSLRYIILDGTRVTNVLLKEINSMLKDIEDRYGSA